ncbi:hypothetical protein P9139_02835 [Curtobacterium flaccumfaciens]|nr:hypothetical protein P9139_02835 [Curtobacterium flaccumfaciens]
MDVIVAALGGRLSRQTVAVRGGETLLLSDAVRRVADVVGRRVVVFPAPVCAHRVLGQVTEWTMKVPLVAKAQVRMLAEGVTDAVQPASELPADLAPRLSFTEDQIRNALPPRGGFTINDLRWAASGPEGATAR